MQWIGKRAALFAVMVGGMMISGCQIQPDYRAAKAAPETVAQVDLDKYAGKWFEIARYPNWFEKNCTNVTAEYAERDDGKISVTNTCFKGSKSGKREVANGRARVVEGSGNAKLKVKFAPAWVPFAEGDYWVMHLEPDYSAALVGAPSGKYLWILARDPVIAPATLTKIKARAEALGFDASALEMTQHE
jgi:apolipoprotein D and lipocalin family protein